MLRACHTVKVPTEGDLLFLAPSVTACAGVARLLETPRRLWLVQPPCPLMQPSGGTNGFRTKVLLVYTGYSSIYSLPFSHYDDLV